MRQITATVEFFALTKGNDVWYKMLLNSNTEINLSKIVFNSTVNELKLEAEEPSNYGTYTITNYSTIH